MNEELARQEICRIGKSLFDRGYVHATAGNISVRLDDGFLITATDSCLGFLDPDDLCKVDLEGKHVAGPRPSKTLALHRGVYRSAMAHGQAPRCILHTHSTHCVLLTLQPTQDELLPPITPYFVMKVGHVPVIAYRRPGDPEVPDLIAAAIARYAQDGRAVRAVMLPRLGPVVWHDTPAQAMATLEELEETARLWSLAPAKPQPLGPDALAELREAFGAHW
jgi:ribulose-5-phosphate 4-epimerase/fuculose-1-phosphate aldolase